MSRSYREPWYIDGYKGSGRRQFFKNYANRRVRRKSPYEEIANGCSYKKYTDPYDICDFKFFWDPEPHVYWHGKNGPEWIYPDEPWKVFRK
jgi:hypothetical protein